MEEYIKSDCSDYFRKIISPATPYVLCNHCFSTEIYKGNHKPIEVDITNVVYNGTNDLYKYRNIDKIKEGHIIQVQVDLLKLFVNEILPKISCKIIIFTSQSNLPQIHRSDLTDSLLANEKIILWISHNPIYTNNSKYMAFPFGLHLPRINEYMGFLKENYNNCLDINVKTKECYNANIRIHGHLIHGHIRRDPFFKKANNIIDYNTFLKNILNSKFTISLSGDRDDCYRHFESIGLNSIPISDIFYKEIFGNNMISADKDEIIEIINGEKKIEFYNTNKDLLLIDYWRDKIEKRIGRKLIVEPDSSTRVNIDPPHLN